MRWPSVIIVSASRRGSRTEYRAFPTAEILFTNHIWLRLPMQKIRHARK